MDDRLKLSLILALVAIGVTSACIPGWTEGNAIITGIFALLNLRDGG